VPQPELTPEEIAEGTDRPENVVGSYAVYHKTKRDHVIGQTNYATGKAFHIYRPKVWDADGNEIWAELSYADGTLSVTVPQSFLDSAVYPVRVDPTFGYTSLGATGNNIGTNVNDQSTRRGTKFTLSEEGTLDSISAGLKLDDAGQSANADTNVFLNREDTGVDSHDEVASIEELNQFYDSTTGAFFEFTASSEALTADDYILSVLANGEDVDTTNLRLQVLTDTGTNVEYAEAATGAGSYAARRENP
jgi:hypothetical protein